MRRPSPTGAATQATTNQYESKAKDTNGSPSFNPFNYLETALGYGKAVWSKVQALPLSEALPLLDLTFLLEEHIESLFEICQLNTSRDAENNVEISTLSSFYQGPELLIHPSKRGISLRESLINCKSKSSFRQNARFLNYYATLYEDPLEGDVSDELQISANKPSSKMTTHEQPTKASFPEDLSIAEVATSIRHRQAVAMEEDSEGDPHEDSLPCSPPRTTTIITTGTPNTTKVRINLIRHRHATSTDKTTLQLFKDFILAAKRTDPLLIVLPIDSTKQNLSSLTSIKQVENLTTNQLRLYFSSWFRDQPHSLSGFLHLRTTLNIESMQTQVPLAEWFATYQYSVTLCRSQEEEMSIIGALCYGSLFLHRDSLLKSILELPEWVQLNQGRENPIIVDLIVKSFKSPGKSTEMIFVRTERSKKEETTKFFLTLYDGTPKRYPRGDMLFFIPVTSKLEAEYTDAQRTKYVFNHTAYLGEEDCFAIFGLADLDTIIILKDGKMVTIRTLLKSLPASEGMSRSRLFQVVDCIPSQNCVLVTFQRADKILVEDRQFTLEEELCEQLAPDQSSKLFVDDVQRLRFGCAYHKGRGKVIKIHNPSQTHLDFVQHADKLLSSPPKKRTSTNVSKSETASSNLSTMSTRNLSYSGMVQAQTTHTRSVAAPNGVTTTTTTQTSQTVMGVIETRFQRIELEQKSLNHRLNNVENRTITTDENIRAMMSHWKITPVPTKRKFLDDKAEDSENNSNAGNAILPALADQGQGATCF